MEDEEEMAGGGCDDRAPPQGGQGNGYGTEGKSTKTRNRRGKDVSNRFVTRDRPSTDSISKSLNGHLRDQVTGNVERQPLLKMALPTSFSFVPLLADLLQTRIALPNVH